MNFTVGQLVQRSDRWLEQHGDRQEDQLGDELRAADAEVDRLQAVIADQALTIAALKDAGASKTGHIFERSCPHCQFTWTMQGVANFCPQCGGKR